MNPPAQKPARSIWPYAIIVWMVVFATGVFSFIVFAQRNKLDLVNADYYAQEIKFQQQIDRVANTRAVKKEVSIRYGAGRIALTLPKDQAPLKPTGSIQLYRPSDASLDRELSLRVGEQGEQLINAKDLRPGLWRVRVTWKVDNQEFYFDDSIVIGA